MYSPASSGRRCGRSADDDGDLALVVEPLAVRRPHDVAAVGVERRHRLVEVRRRRRGAGAELAHPAGVVEVDADDLRRLDRRQVDGASATATVRPSAAASVSPRRSTETAVAVEQDRLLENR